VTQDAAPCTFSVDPRGDSVGAAGGQKTIAVTPSSPQCTWTARSDVDWLVIVDGAQGTGTGQVRYEARSTTGAARNGTLQVAGQVVTIAQGNGCHYVADPASQSIAAAGGPISIAVHSTAGCEWSASSSVPWLALTSAAAGSGEGRVQFTAAASTGPARSATLTVAGQPVTVTQASGCSYVLAPASQDFGNGDGTGRFAVTTAPGCAWSAASRAPWLAIAGGASGIGSGAVSFSVAANPMGVAAKTGTITVNDQPFTVNQAAGPPCVYTLTGTSEEFAAAGGIWSFSVTTALACSWTATSNAPWIAITGSPTGTGSGIVIFNVAANPAGSPGRIATIAVRDVAFTVLQDASGP
jgi:hypothetical protein